MATTKEKTEIRKLARKGLSINQIKEKLNLPKSTVYYHFKKEVGQKQKRNQLEIPDDPEFHGELCGIFAGDGNYFFEEKNYKYRITFTLNINEDYWQNLESFLEENLDKRPHVKREPNHSRVRLRYESKTLYEFFKKYLEWGEDKTETIMLRNLNNLSRAFKIGFVRGLVDTDGHKIKQFRGYKIGTISKNMMSQTSKILDELDIQNTLSREPDKRENCRDMYRLTIYGDNAEKLEAKIDPRHPKKQSK